MIFLYAGGKKGDGRRRGKGLTAEKYVSCVELEVGVGASLWFFRRLTIKAGASERSLAPVRVEIISLRISIVRLCSVLLIGPGEIEISPPRSIWPLRLLLAKKALS